MIKLITFFKIVVLLLILQLNSCSIKKWEETGRYTADKSSASTYIWKKGKQYVALVRTIPVSLMSTPEPKPLPIELLSFFVATSTVALRAFSTVDVGTTAHTISVKTNPQTRTRPRTTPRLLFFILILNPTLPDLVATGMDLEQKYE